MRIAIIELDYHAEVLSRFCSLFQGDDRVRISVYTKPSVFRLVPEAARTGISWQVKPAWMPGELFLLLHLGEINQHDLLIFNTAASHFAAYALLPWKPVTLVRNHNTHTNFAALRHLYLPLTPYFLFKGVSYLFRRHLLRADWLFRPWFYRKVQYVSFLTAPIEAYALNHGFITPARTGPRLPLVVYESHFAKPQATDALWLTIPGTIDNRKKAYAFMLEVLRQWLPAAARPVVISLLGRPKDQYGEAVCRSFQALASASVRVQVWPGVVPQEDFDQTMQQTDLILAPILPDTSYAIYRERYGTTKISGAVFDMIRYGKPILLPASYPLEDQLLPMALQYTGAADALEQLLHFAGTYDAAAWELLAARTFSAFTEDTLHAESLNRLQALCARP